jgi:hypothetical protein
MSPVSKELLRALQARAARAALGPSSMRGAGSRGVVAAGRSYLSVLNLRPFGNANQRRFRRAVDDATAGLLQSLPSHARHWGLARKGLNIFLRDCLYTVYLRDAYGLGSAESNFEIPLDSLTGRALWKAAKGSLPRWDVVRRLRPALSDRFQAVAAQLAATRGIARVHLDAFWWGERRERGGA